jgi:hypothetical protein
MLQNGRRAVASGSAGTPEARDIKTFSMRT